jgi:hypothetical protein
MLGLLQFTLAAVLVSPLPDQVDGSMRVDGDTVTLTHVRAHFHDNAEGLMNHKKELRILLTDRAVPGTALYGTSFPPIWQMAMKGEVQGILLDLDPAKPTEVQYILLMKPKQKGASLMTGTLSVTGKNIFENWKYTTGRVSGSVDQQKDGIEGGDIPKLAYKATFDTAVAKEPAVTQDLKGAQAQASLQVKTVKASAEAMSRGDFVALKKLATKQGAAHLDEMIAQAGPEAKNLAKRFGDEMKASVKKVKRVVVRGNRAIVMMEGGMSANVVLEGGVWKTDN